ncbi:hypothetical protein ACTM97_06310 [Oliverpabstia intestinalis]|uniref:hypothetical protein n=1 Tax=Oliverpabstia intestinalis TaxID=2606633 RepID=UPI003F8C6D65
MGKKDKIKNSAEFKYFEEHYDEIMEEFEKDNESADYKIPDEWDQRFRKTIEDTIKREERKKVYTIFKVVGVVTAAIFVLLVGNFSVEQVNGEGLLEIFQNSFALGDKQHTTYGTNNEIEFSEEENENIIYFSGDDLDDINEQIREEIKCPMFYLGYIPEGFVVEEATYEMEYRMINIKLSKGEEYIYIFQQKQVDDISFGFVEEEKREIALLNNEELSNPIYIYDGFQDKSWLIEVKENNDLLNVDASTSKEDCMKIAENIEYH